MYSMGNIRSFHLYKSITFAAFFSLTVVLFGAHDGYAESTGATLKIVPASGTFYVDKTFDVSIVLDTGSQSVNAVAAELRFPPDIIQITNPAAGSSIISLWSSPPTYSNEEGIVRLQGGIPSPGIKTSQGVVTTFTFRAMRPGTASILFTGNSQVLANDGQGTNILSLTIGASYKIDLPPPEGPAVSSPTHPNQNAWYKSTSPTLQWVKEEGVSNFAWLLDQDAGGVANAVEPKGLNTSTSFESLEDGFWYFHIRAKKGGTWGGVTTFLVRIDSTNPADFKLEFAPGEVTSDRRPFVNFVTTDALSGINRYEVRPVPTSGISAKTLDGISSFFITAQSPYRFSELEPGGYDVIVRVYDNAGNIRETIGHIDITSGAIAVVLLGIKFGPWFFSWWKLSVGTIAIALFAFWFFWQQRIRHKRLSQKLDSDITKMRERLQHDYSEVSEHLQEEEHLKARLAEQLKNLETIEKERGRSHGKISIVLIIVITGAFLCALFGAGIFSHANGQIKPISLLFAEKPGASLPNVLVIKPPIITTFRGQLGSDELLYLGGTVLEDSVVVISFSQEHQEPFVVETRADQEGRWSYLHPRFLQQGVYQVYARSRDDLGNLSEWGSPVTIEVVSHTVSFGGLTLSYQALVGFANILLILIAAGLGGIAFWMNRRSNLLLRRLHEEVREAEFAVQEGFRVLRQDLEKELELVGAADFPSRKLSQEEKVRREQLVVDLRAIEERVRKEVEDIRSVM